MTRSPFQQFANMTVCLSCLPQGNRFHLNFVFCVDECYQCSCHSLTQQLIFLSAQTHILCSVLSSQIQFFRSPHMWRSTYLWVIFCMGTLTHVACVCVLHLSVTKDGECKWIWQPVEPVSFVTQSNCSSTLPLPRFEMWCFIFFSSFHQASVSAWPKWRQLVLYGRKEQRRPHSKRKQPVL